MKKQVISLDNRNCDACQSTKLEELWKYEHTAISTNYEWLFRVNNVICQDCGFVFTSPVLNNEELLEYYADSFTPFTNQALDYDINKRLHIINKYVKEKNTFVEFGANKKTQFHRQLGEEFESVLTIEPNQNAESDFDKIEDSTGLEADCVAHYFVLEHVPTIDDFLSQINSILKEGGIMICEVPLLSLYETYISPLLLHEHVNHFSEQSLRCIAAKHGFELLEASTEYCSRPFGFVSIFKKTKKKTIQVNNEYEINKSDFNKGLKQVNLFYDKIEKVSTIIKQTQDTVLIWAANETSNRLLKNITLKENIYIIDSNPSKKNYFEGIKEVLLPSLAVKQIQQANHIILCTENHATAILSDLENLYQKTFLPENIYIVDRL